MKKLIIFGYLLISGFTYAQENTFKISNLVMNDDKSQYGLVYYKENKVFFTAYTFNEFDKIKKNRDGQLIYGLYEGLRKDDGEIINVKPFKASDNFVFNSSSASFSPDGKYIYITTNDDARGEVYKHDSKTRNLRIERGEYDSGKGWTNFITLSFCNPNYSYGHPTISPDGNTLYFVSNIPSAKGPTDIFRVTIKENNQFSEPENLGDLVNSPRKEMFPFVSNKNVLYFSSDRAGGAGGLDVYSCQLLEDGRFEKPVLLPQPINSRQDDFCFVFSDNGKEGYFSSNRGKGKGEDDIYYFTLE